MRMTLNKRISASLAAILSMAASSACMAQSPAALEEYRGRVVYLDFWASWCTPCQQSFPWMQSLKDTYQAAGLEVMAVNLDRRRADAERFLTTKRTDFDVRFDPQGLMAEAFKVKGMPTSVLIDRHGTVRFTHIGFRPIDGPAYEAQLKLLLAEK
jgi:cytochrome c biogenesis protein CcmG/thiol:disulfide interchange protein DsbE